MQANSKCTSSWIMLRNLRGQQINPHSVSMKRLGCLHLPGMQSTLVQISPRRREPEVPDTQPAVVAGADQDVCRLVCKVHVPYRQRMHIGPVACRAPFPDVPCLCTYTSSWGQHAGGLGHRLLPVQVTTCMGVGQGAPMITQRTFMCQHCGRRLQSYVAPESRCRRPRRCGCRPSDPSSRPGARPWIHCWALRRQCPAGTKLSVP